MTTIFITLGLIITYFIISAIKENETRETIERERRENTKNIANLHYNNMVEQVLQHNKILEESRKIFVEQHDKIDFFSMFSNFSFSTSIAKLLLEESTERKKIILSLYRLRSEKEAVIEKLFKIFIRKNYNCELIENYSNFYTLNNFKFYLFSFRNYDKDTLSYYERLVFNFDHIIIEKDIGTPIIEDFIVYCVKNRPTAIFVVVNGLLRNDYEVWRVFNDGSSVNLGHVQKNEDLFYLTFINNYVKENI